MGDRAFDAATRRLINLVREFVNRPEISNSALPEVLATIERRGWPAVIFGGLLRDLMIHGLAATPRDVDIVVDVSSNDKLHTAFSDIAIRRTRFGGLVIDLGALRADIWSLRSTWAFESTAFAECSFAALPKTTFLNVEAIAVDLPRAGSSQQVFDAGFFAALANQEIEVNFEPNPFPALCIVRSLVTAQRTDFSLGENLVRYILHWSDRVQMSDLLDVQISHYGEILLPATRIQHLFARLRHQRQIRFSVPHL